MQKKELDELEQVLPQLEEEIVSLETSLNEISDFAAIRQVSKRLDDLRKELEEKTVRWMELSELEG